ncbi:STAS domain-containing protein [Dasania sp. GY-MA-18]|uniref:STAS domain-containing protein n=1 Tax=Dasania phycosphaerae TaxID=2950436 RepID=A0A9J6RQS3_9GAMM|nr:MULTISPECIES: STAS domain-containing protein [Dasania]MCR8923963.1 STAS domain-containing protein [Dasania sp. GY-MA-18]MCZ0866397.1 STAS domain-containing protein [Dasania phycosphaerae]MCZ0870121.1 STAS domain-containing protein [Dasania phycosphaerae]
MPIATSQQEQEFTITLDEKFNFDSVEQFREAYTDKNAETYIVDFRATEYMDSSGLGMLLNMRRYLTEKNISTIKLINCRPQIKKVLIISRFESKFIIA